MVISISAEVGPILLPRLRDFRVFSVPAFGKRIQSIQGGLFINRSVDCFQVSHQEFQVLVGDIFAGVAQLMNNAILNLRLRVYSINCVGKPSQIVRASDENILYSPVPQTVQDGSPEFSTFIFTNPHTENILFAIQIVSNGNVNGFLHNLPFAANMVM